MSKIDLRIRNNNKLYSIVLNDYRIGGCKWNDIEHGKCIEFPVNKEDVFVALGVDKTIANLQSQLDQANERLKEIIIDYANNRKRLYNIYKKMTLRCYDKKDPAYKNYGGRGIVICNEWLNHNGMLRFFSWAMNNGYNKTLCIDRIDNNKNYSPENCRWVDRKTQNNNTRRNLYVTYKSETMTLSQVCEKYHKSVDTVWSRIKRGWDIVEAIERPIKQGCYVRGNKTQAKLQELRGGE